MNYISAENISKRFGDRWLFESLTFGISQGDKVALIGPNGTGKTTLMKIVSGHETPDQGHVASNKDISIGYLSQVPTFDPKMTVSETIFVGDNPMINAIQQYDHCIQHPEEADQLQAAMEQMDSLQAWDYEVQIKQILGQLGIHDLSLHISQLSGGQQKRVALAQLLIHDYDLIILDEPTNHLDIETIEWLEKRLTAANTTLLLVTHDRYFLDNVCNTIFELDQGQLYTHKGNYAYFLQKKSERIANQQTVIDKAKNLYSKELEWMRRQPKARGTKAKYRVEAFDDVKKKAHQNLKDDSVQLDVKTSRQGKKVIEIHKISKAFDDKVILQDFSYIFRRKERIGIVGKNGAGKSTFLNLLAGKIDPDQGEIIKGETTKIGYYTQHNMTFKPEQRVIDVAKEIAEVISLSNGEQLSVSSFLTRFLFPPKVQYKPVEKLSGGEKKRLQLMLVLIQNPNFLILDEPTNDLDLDTLNVLEDFLMAFGGCLILVSHDRYFMDKLVDHLFVLEGDGIVRDFNGNYSDYRQEHAELLTQQKAQQKKTESKKAEKHSDSSDTKKKLSFKEKREYEQLEKEIEKLEQSKDALTQQLNSGETDHQKLKEWAEQIQNINDDLEEKEMRWLELSEWA